MRNKLFHFLVVLVSIIIFWNSPGQTQTDTLNISWNINPPSDTVQYYLLHRQFCNTLADTSLPGSVIDTLYENSATIIGNRIIYTDLERNLINPGELISYRVRAFNIHGGSEISAHDHAGIPEITWTDTHIDSGITTSFPFNSFLNDPDHDAAQLLVHTAQPSQLVLQIQNNILYITPDPINYTGPASFELTVFDPDSFWDHRIVNLTIDTSQASQNNPPVAINDTVNTPEGTPVTIQVLANDYDPDGDPLAVSDIVGDPQHGTSLISQSTRIIYTPQSSYVGEDSFRYEIHDGRGGRDSATVYVTITSVPPVNSKPIARNDSANVTQGEAVTVNVLVNDEDPDGDPLTVSGLVSTPVQGSAVINAGATISYTAPASYVGLDSFQYEIHDGRGGRDTASVYVTISLIPNTKPIARDDLATVTQGEAVTVSVLNNDEDPDGDQLSVTTITTNPTHGSTAINSGITVTYTSSATYVGLDSFQYAIHDGRGGRDTASVRINVTSAPNGKPVAIDDSVTLSQPLPVTIDVLENDFDPDGDPLSVSNIITLPAFGLAAINQGRTVTYSPGFSFVDFDQFQYEIHDGRGGRDTATVKVILFATEAISENLIAFPNPYRSTSDYPNMVFEPLPPAAREIIIVNTLGKIVYQHTLDPTQAPRFEWNVKNLDQQEVASGLYIYLIKGSGGDKIASGKIAVIR